MTETATPAAEPKKRSIWKTGCLVLLGLFALLVLIGLFAPKPDPAEQAAREEAEQVEAAVEAQEAVATATEVSSRDLAAAFEANEVAAQQNYGGKALLVTGAVVSITLDFADEPVVQLPGVNQFLNVQASLEDAGAAAALAQGQEVRLLCTELSEVIGAPMLRGCTLVE